MNPSASRSSLQCEIGLQWLWVYGVGCRVYGFRVCGETLKNAKLCTRHLVRLPPRDQHQKHHLLQGVAFSVSGLGFRVQGSKFRVQSLKFRVWGFRVYAEREAVT